MTTQDRFNISRLKVPLLLTAAFWVIAVVLWRTTGNIFYLYNFGYIGTALGTGIGVYAALPRRRKLWGRRVAQFLVGSYMDIRVADYIRSGRLDIGRRELPPETSLKGRT